MQIRMEWIDVHVVMVSNRILIGEVAAEPIRVTP